MEVSFECDNIYGRQSQYLDEIFDGSVKFLTDLYVRIRTRTRGEMLQTSPSFMFPRVLLRNKI